MNKKDTVLPVSVIIPTYCEEKWLPILLESIKNQVLQPLEVIVADAQSADKTREIAKSYGAKVVEGGKIAFGRNAGAKVAKGEFFLFMDGDTELPTKTAIADAFINFLKDSRDIASARFVVNPEREDNFLGVISGKIIWGIANIWRFFQNQFQKIVFEGGAFILIRKDVFLALYGFDEKLDINEDPDLFKRAVKAGYKYGHLNVNIVTSSRRFDTPKKIMKMGKFFLINTALLSAGLYVGSKLIKKNWKNYGRLGGGKGKKPGEG